MVELYLSPPKEKYDLSVPQPPVRPIPVGPTTPDNMQGWKPVSISPAVDALFTDRPISDSRFLADSIYNETRANEIKGAYQAKQLQEFGTLILNRINKSPLPNGGTLGESLHDPTNVMSTYRFVDGSLIAKLDSLAAEQPVESDPAYMQMLTRAKTQIEAHKQARTGMKKNSHEVRVYQ